MNSTFPEGIQVEVVVDPLQDQRRRYDLKITRLWRHGARGVHLDSGIAGASIAITVVAAVLAAALPGTRRHAPVAGGSDAVRGVPRPAPDPYAGHPPPDP